jgi:SAM-dependent methyltransferase
MTPEVFRTREVTEFLVSALTGCTRVLEVGCGRGAVARELAARGFAITALDVELRDLVDAPGVTFVERDFLAYDAPPFDAIVFTASLHHIAPLAAAIDRAHALLVPGGRFVADEFDLDAPDARTLGWYYDTQQQLVAEGYDAHRIDHPHGDLVHRWQHAHAHDTRLHTGAEMLAAIGARFSLGETQRLPYLYRYITTGLPQDDRGGDIAARVRATEQRLIDERAIAAVGLRISALSL